MNPCGEIMLSTPQPCIIGPADAIIGRIGLFIPPTLDSKHITYIQVMIHDLNANPGTNPIISCCIEVLDNRQITWAAATFTNGFLIELESGEIMTAQNMNIFTRQLSQIVKDWLETGEHQDRCLDEYGHIMDGRRPLPLGSFNPCKG